jgi:hypothetical protein
MTIDCTNLKPGDKVRLRDNRTFRVTEDVSDSKIRLTTFRLHHSRFDGKHLHGCYGCDIVEILTNPEPEMDTTTFPFSWRYHLDILELSDFTFRDPAKIIINGKQYVPAKDSNLCYLLPHKKTYITSATTNEVVAIICNGKRFTPADSWPEPITDRDPTEEDVDKKGEVQILNSSGDWKRYTWNGAGQHFHSRFNLGWARTSDWKPRPIDKKTLTIYDLKKAMRDGEDPDHDTLQSAIELLEATL